MRLNCIRSFATTFMVACTVVAFVAALAHPAIASGQGTIAGSVRDSTGLGIVDAEVSIPGTALRAETDDRGAFTLIRVPGGTVSLRVRRLGFAPATTEATVRTGAVTHVTVVVTGAVHELSRVVVRADRLHRYTGYLAGFYERRDRGFGRFITGDEIRKRDPSRLTDMLRIVPGINIQSAGVGDPRVRIRGGSCAPSVWLDGTPANAAELDLDGLTPSSVDGVEIYSGVATVPAEFVDPLGPKFCGTIVLWTRQGEPVQRRKKPVTAARLAELVANLQIYTSDQVDTPARPDTSATFAPVYPEPLYRARIPGEAVMEFVVDTTGHAQIETIGVVSSTDALFADAVRRALSEARFVPARLGGRPVPQIVRQPFTFVPSNAGTRHPPT